MKVLIAMLYPALVALQRGNVALAIVLLGCVIGVVSCAFNFEWHGG